MGDVEVLSTNELMKAHIWNIPRGLMNGLAKVGDVLHLPLNSQRMQKLTENYVVSNVQAKLPITEGSVLYESKNGAYQPLEPDEIMEK